MHDMTDVANDLSMTEEGQAILFGSPKKPPVIKNPCDNCPFRSDRGPFGLAPGRAQEIAESLIQGYGSVFPCHKTIDYASEEADKDWTSKTRPCAGACIVTIRTLGQPNGVMQIGERFKLFDLSQLNMDAAVYESMDAFIKANEEE